MNNWRCIFVLTATVDPFAGGNQVTMSDRRERLRQYLDNIRALILTPAVTHIVFCENSDYRYDYGEMVELARRHDTVLEILTFMGSNEVIRRKGKSYGEAEILNYAVDTSAWLRDSRDCFYKLTGRITVANLNAILEETGHDNVFIRWDIRKNEVDTRFFKVQVGFYRESLYPLLEQMDESCGCSIEEVYFNYMKGNRLLRSFRRYPVIRGICASLGKPYDLGLFKSLYRKLQLKAGLLDLRRVS